MNLWGLFPDQKNRIGRMKGFGGCYRCGDSWYWKPQHVTTFNTSTSGASGCFPLCEECWAALTPEERLPYYVLLMSRWIDGPEEFRLEYLRKWPLIEKAVLDGL